MEDVACALCGARDEKLLYEAAALGGDGELFRVVRCRKCGLVYVNPRPDREEKRKYYDELYPFAASRSGQQESFYRPMIDYLKRQPGAPGRLLDIGTGNSPFLPMMRDSGWQVQGTEVDPKLVKRYREEFGIELHEGELVEAGFKTGSFDAVTLMGVIEHVGDPRGLMDEIHRILKPGGVLGIWYFNRGFEAKVLGKGWMGFDVPRHVYSYSAGSMSRLLEGAGLKIDSRVCSPPVSYIVFRLSSLGKRKGQEKTQIGYAGMLSKPFQLANKVAGRSLAALGLGSNVFVFAVRD